MSQPNTPASISSVSSFQSFLSEDSYLEKMKPVDAGFFDMISEIRALDTKRSMVAERKVQSHIQKRRDQTDIARREDWTAKQIQEYENYKNLVRLLENANKNAVASAKVAKARDDEESCKKALEDQKARSDAAIQAAKARLGFMTKYPNAYTTLSHRNHIKAMEANLDSAKLAQREVQKQLKNDTERSGVSGVVIEDSVSSDLYAHGL